MFTNTHKRKDRIVLKNDLLLGVKAAAGYTGLSERSIYHMIDRKKIPHGRVGVRIFFRRSELDIYFSSKQSPVSPISQNDDAS